MQINTPSGNTPKNEAEKLPLYVDIKLYDIDTFMTAHNLSRNKFYSEVKKKRLRITKLEKRTYVTKEDAEAWVIRIREETIILP